MSNYDSIDHVIGASLFLDDLPEPVNCLHAAICPSPVAHGKLKKINIDKALGIKGVITILTADSIPGENQIGTIIQDEPLLADKEVDFIGQPVALVVAGTARQADKAVKLIELEIEELPPVFDPRQAAANGDFIAPSRTLALGDIDKAWEKCATVVEGRTETGGQEHLYLEPQGSMAMPDERGGIMLYSSTQSPTAVQRVTSRVLGIAMHLVQVEVKRLGGGFGGKEDQATVYAVLAALAALHTSTSTKLILNRQQDMQYTGKRHPYSSDFKIGLDENGKILAYEVTYFQNAGAAADLSTAVLERSLYHATNAYYIPNVRITGHCCKTNNVPNTAFRGFGAPQALFVIESAIAKAAGMMKLPAWRIQEKNLLKEYDTFPYGARARQCHAKRAFSEILHSQKWEVTQKDIFNFNKNNSLIKKGAALMPICFGISFTTGFLNQAGALIHIYSDGSISVSTGAVEMGQGVNTKIIAIVAHTLGVNTDIITVQPTATRTVANTSPTAASAAADLNGMAAKLAADTLRLRLMDTAASRLGEHVSGISINNGKILLKGQPTELDWHALISDAYLSRINLSAQAHYATPDIYFDKNIEKGQPFAYYVYGTASIQVSVDILRGIVTIDAVNILHDAGRSLNQDIDRGQALGAIMQGIGWLTMEELVYNKEGRLLTDSLTTYKVPDIHSMPSEFNVSFMEDTDNPHAVLQSKGIGEPPFLYGTAAYFAIMNALIAARPDKPMFFNAPLTHEKILHFLTCE
ncbi:molybdopterin-dependent oxidoreductase [bacterium]|nr:molybdopterin-dependent oxidoreductase [bacterium]